MDYSTKKMSFSLCRELVRDRWKILLAKLMFRFQEERFQRACLARLKHAGKIGSRELILRAFDFIFRNWSMIEGNPRCLTLAKVIRDKFKSLRNQGLDLGKYEAITGMASISCELPVRVPVRPAVRENLGLNLRAEGISKLCPNVLGKVNEFLSYGEYGLLRAVSRYLWKSLKKAPAQPHGKYLNYYLSDACWLVELYHDGKHYYISASDYHLFHSSAGLHTSLHYQDDESEHLICYRNTAKITPKRIDYVVETVPSSCTDKEIPAMPETHRRVILEAIRIMHNDRHECDLQVFRECLEDYTMKQAVERHNYFCRRNRFDLAGKFFLPKEAVNRVIPMISDLVFDPRR